MYMHIYTHKIVRTRVCVCIECIMYIQGTYICVRNRHYGQVKTTVTFFDKYFQPISLLK